MKITKFFMVTIFIANSINIAAAADPCEVAFQKADDSQIYPDKAAGLKYFESMRNICWKNTMYISRLSSFYEKIGQKKEAERITDEGLISYPLDRQLLFNKGTIELDNGKFESAQAIAEKIIQLQQNWSGGFYLMQRALMDQRRFAESLRFGKKAIELAEIESSTKVIHVFYLNLAVASFHSGDLDACATYTEIAVNKDPAVLAQPWGINEAIYALGRLDRRAEAMSLAKRRKNADPNWRSDPALVRALKVMGIAE